MHIHRSAQFGSSALITLSLALVLSLASSPAYAQSMYLARGTSGIGFSGSFMTGDNWNGLGLNAGYSFSGLVDLDLGYAHRSIEDGQLSANALAPSVSFCALKQSDEMPLSLALGLGYEHNSFNGDVLDAMGWDMTSHAYSLGLSVYRSMPASASLSVFPTFSVGYTHTNMKLKDADGHTASSDDDSNWFGFGMSFALAMPRGQTFTVTPSVSVIEDETSFRLATGFVFPR